VLRAQRAVLYRRHRRPDRDPPADEREAAQGHRRSPRRPEVRPRPAAALAAADHDGAGRAAGVQLLCDLAGAGRQDLPRQRRHLRPAHHAAQRRLGGGLVRRRPGPPPAADLPGLHRAGLRRRPDRDRVRAGRRRRLRHAAADRAGRVLVRDHGIDHAPAALGAELPRPDHGCGYSSTSGPRRSAPSSPARSPRPAGPGPRCSPAPPPACSRPASPPSCAPRPTWTPP